ncbi:serine hydrolase domain-containing protein [Haliscomenobacter hydrossis]|uniref:Beta-lactamase n=1 Tax=Haliscomenobacter hydrossis (strain ATCC 27775 / DSM 1100 / LMG 10767 / O) TaxID=760192 RepID=F4KRV2_HALH1|nr:serine hydrolase [Haliscomenobacter hydrossis]AEE50056.1 beta-lactamase [Haliscomenobacter hydrossis DSM 1100]
MSLPKRILRIALYFVVFILLYNIRYYYQYAKIGAAYNAKMACSCVFVSGRSLASVEKEDLYAIPFASQTVDRRKQTVTSTLFGVVSKTALYRPGLGCTLLNTVGAAELQRQTELVVLSKGAQELPDSTLPAAQGQALAKTLDWAFAEKDPSRPVLTRAVVVLHQGKVVAERYAPGINRNTPLLGWSMTKSVTNAMIGILVKDGKLVVDAPAPIDEWKDDKRKAIKLDNLLRMNSGLRFDENYGKVSAATKMLFKIPNAGQYALRFKARAEPGQEWYYSSGTSNILQEIIRRQFNSLNDYLAFPHQRLFDKLGMSTAVMEPDPAGNYVGSSFMFASARDWAKFGQLYLQDGAWNGEQILPRGWAAYSAKETPNSDGQYAAQFWIGYRKDGMPADLFYADGFEGQRVLIVPSKELVVVRLGCTGYNNFEDKRFFKEILGVF